MHLVISHQGTKVMGPVSRKYRYTMQGLGNIIDLKFNLGVLAKELVSRSIKRGIVSLKRLISSALINKN